MAITDKPSIAELQEAVRFMSPVDQYKAKPSWNNGGMPLADFSIPGHNGGATAEMLAEDAHGIVELRTAAPVLLEIAAAALAYQVAECDNKRCHHPAHRSPCAILTAQDALERSLAKVRP